MMGTVLTELTTQIERRRLRKAILVAYDQRVINDVALSMLEPSWEFRNDFKRNLKELKEEDYLAFENATIEGMIAYLLAGMVRAILLHYDIMGLELPYDLSENKLENYYCDLLNEAIDCNVSIPKFQQMKNNIYQRWA